jgi:Aminoglycoside-2''-adenylyltransferase
MTEEMDCTARQKKAEKYPAASLAGKGEIESHTVRCISPEWMVKFHSGYQLKEKDFPNRDSHPEKSLYR